MSKRRSRDNQLHLFGTPEPRARDTSVGPAELPEAVRDVAARLPRSVYLGTSSWSFPGWEGRVYDRRASTTTLARRGLAAYAAHPLLRAVGIDRTFYAPLPAKDLARYAEAVPEDFRFLVKASNRCTMPNPLFLDVGYAVDAVVGPFVEGLGPRGGPLLFQFSPMDTEFTRDPDRFAERLGAFLAALPRGPRYAVELRDQALLCPAYLEALERSGATHCLGLHPRMPSVAEQRRRAEALPDGPCAVRWMLHSGLGYEVARERYAPFDRIVDEDLDSRAALADLCLSRIEQGKEIVVVANNKAEGSAPETLYRLAGAIVERLRETDAPPA